jgi:hypothetical protein
MEFNNVKLVYARNLDNSYAFPLLSIMIEEIQVVCGTLIQRVGPHYNEYRLFDV